MQLHEQQRLFGTALLDARLPAPAGLIGPDGEHSPRRFNVYRNNVVVGLISTLKDAYPATLRIVGDEFFKAMAAAFAVKHPPTSPIMLDYGVGFATFISQFKPASSLPYLSDVAALERAWAEAYHASEATSIDPASLATLPPEHFANVVFTLHPSLRIVKSPFPIITIWNMNNGENKIATVDLDVAETALLLRPEALVEVRAISPSTATFIGALNDKSTVATALHAALGVNPQFNLAEALNGLFQAGACSAWHVDHQHTD